MTVTYNFFDGDMMCVRMQYLILHGCSLLLNGINKEEFLFTFDTSYNAPCLEPDIWGVVTQRIRHVYHRGEIVTKASLMKVFQSLMAYLIQPQL